MSSRPSTTVLSSTLFLRSSSATASTSRTAERGAQHRTLLRVLAGLDPHRDLDLALAREQRDLAHLAQVDAHRVVRGRVVDRLRGRRATRRGPATRDHADAALADQRADLCELVFAEIARQRAGHLFRGSGSRAACRPRPASGSRADRACLFAAGWGRSWTWGGHSSRSVGGFRSLVATGGE
jgi:hypothetical protein